MRHSSKNIMSTLSLNVGGRLQELVCVITGFLLLLFCVCVCVCVCGFLLLLLLLLLLLFCFLVLLLFFVVVVLVVFWGGLTKFALGHGSC